MRGQEGVPTVHHPSKMVAEVIIDRCKGCELCVIVCDAAKHHAITMQAVSATGQLMSQKGESAAIGQAYQG
jgi:pyruvate ferredoxin oxidoreductase delta subunit